MNRIRQIHEKRLWLLYLGFTKRILNRQLNKCPAMYYTLLCGFWSWGCWGRMFSGRFKNDLLVQQARFGNVDLVSDLLYDNANPMYRRHRGLKKAIMYNHRQVVYTIIKHSSVLYWDSLDMSFILNPRLALELIFMYPLYMFNQHYAVIRMSITNDILATFSVTVVYGLLKFVILLTPGASGRYTRNIFGITQLELPRVPTEFHSLLHSMGLIFMFGLIIILIISPYKVFPVTVILFLFAYFFPF